ncbi:MAG: molybdopterin cofactor-binding domain-containing protein, partial [Pseudomonadales bacterium]
MSKLAHLRKYGAPAITRRGFMIGATSAGFTLAFVPAALLSTTPARAMAEDRFEPTVWYAIDPAGIITVNVAEAEMGQHVGTALARIVAEELEADWNDVRLNHVDSEARYGYRVTGGSWSVWQNFDLLSRAGAAGRQALVEEGAKLLGESANQCSASNSRVICGNKTISYGEIVSRGNITRSYSDEDLSAMPIKAPSQRKLIGNETRALDIPAKTRGETIYGIDATVEGMVYAKPMLPPTRYGSRITSIDDAGARSVNGYQQTLALEDPSNTVPGWALVIADSYHAALEASRKIRIQYDTGETANVSEADIRARAESLIASDNGSLVVDDPGVDDAFGTAKKVFSQKYTTGTALHFQMEPVNALALQRNGMWELHTGNQWQSLAIPWYATALGVPEDKILMKTYHLGGGFGRRLNGDYGVPALLATKALGVPVKVVLDRSDDSRFDSPRSTSVQQLEAAIDKNGQITGMQHHAAAGWPTEAMAGFFLGTGLNGEKFDPFSINGANHWYTLGAHRVRAISNDLANKTFRPGWLRSVGPGWTNWASESFMDELAHELGIDPVQFRLNHLKPIGKNAGSEPNSIGGASRLANVLRRAVVKSGWGRPLPKDTGMGV